MEFFTPSNKTRVFRFSSFWVNEGIFSDLFFKARGASSEEIMICDHAVQKNIRF